MFPEQPLRSEGPPPRDIHAHAMDNLRFIRQTMESAGAFTAVSGWGQVAIGITALAAAYLASLQATPGGWLAVWMAEAALAVSVGSFWILRKARRTGIPLTSGPGRKAAICFSPPLLTGALLSIMLYRAGAVALLPATWLLLFGTAVVTGGALSVRIVPVMGLVFMALGAAAFLSPPALGNLFMAAGFGGVMIVFGLIIARRHGG